MSLKERIYSVLIVSSSEAIRSSFSSLLPESKYSPVHFVTDISSARRAFTEYSFDFVIINSPVHDDTGVQFAIDVCKSKGTIVLLIVRAELHSHICDKVTEHGVFTLIKPTSKPAVTTALSWMTSARERLRKSESKTLSVTEKMEEIRFVNRAKWLLIGRLNMDEPEAHRYIEKQAMDRCVTKREVAEEIIKKYS